MKATSITIITPSFNQAQFIEQTIDSVLSQQYPRLEYIIIDGGSKDGSAEIIRKYEKHLAYWISEPDRGQSEAINKGIGRATGEVINWLNSDDYFQKDALRYIGEVFEDPHVRVLCGRSRKFSTENEFVSEGTDVFEGNLAKTIGWARIDQPETFFRKEAFDSVGNVSTVLHYLMDREWWLRYLLKFGLDGISKSEKVLVNFRLHDNSKTVSQSRAFQVDHDAIFAGLARASGFQNSADFIKAQFQTNPDYRFPSSPASTHLVYNALAYYFLHRSHELYYQRDFISSRQVLSMVDTASLATEDASLYRRIKFRTTPPISHLIKGLSVWRRN